MDFHAQLTQNAEVVEAALLAALPNDGSQLCSAMRYAATGGKRLRGFLVMTTAEVFGGAHKAALTAAVAIEALHAYSLVHDDLPSMDNDALRRGRATVHVKWDEATAVLVGDALQAFAFEQLAGLDAPADVRVELILSLARAGGAMVQGQSQDILAGSAKVPLSLSDITALQSQKTGALIEWSVLAGARLAQDCFAGGNERAITEGLACFARAVGLAYQIRDDILDSEGCVQTLGKRAQKDVSANKATFVSILGMEGAKMRAAELCEEACAALSPLGARGATLADFARFVIARKA